MLLAEKTDAESNGQAFLRADIRTCRDVRVEFLLSLKRYKVFPFTAELDDLESAYV